MSYDEAYKKAEEIVRGLENAQALSMEEYRRQSAEAERLLAFCREQLTPPKGESSINN